MTDKLGQREASGEGDFVLDSMVTEGSQFGHVADYWLDNGCISFEDGKTLLADQQSHIQDIRSPLKEWQCRARHDGVVFVHLPTDREFVPNSHSLNHLCAIGRGLSTWQVNGLLAPIPHATKKDDDGNAEPIKGGERTLADYGVLRDLINIHVFNPARLDQERERLFRTWDTGELRAVLSDKYAIVNNGWYLDLLSKIIPGGVLSHWKGDADTIYGNVLIPDTIRQEADSDFGGMLSVGNSEIGTRRITSLPSVFRAICMNGCIWDQETGKALNRVHKGQIDFEQLALAIAENLQAQIPLLPLGIDKVLGLRAYGMGETRLPNMLATLSADYSLSKRQVKDVWGQYAVETKLLGGEAKTAYGLMNAVTRAGQEGSPDKWVKFDMIGGDMANMNRNAWDKFRNRADNLSDKQVEKRVGQLVTA